MDRDARITNLGLLKHGSHLGSELILRAVNDWDTSFKELLSGRPSDLSIVRFADSVRFLRELNDDMLQLQPLRPIVSQLARWRKMSQTLVLIANQTLEAFTSADISFINETRKQNQKRLDHLSQLQQEANIHGEAARLLEGGDSRQNGFDNLLAALRVRYPNQSLTELDRTGIRIARQITMTEVAEGLGLEFLSLTLLADVHLDPKNFRDLIKMTSDLFSRNGERARNLSRNSQVLSDLRRAKESIADIHLGLEDILANELTDVQILRQLMNLYRSLYEEGGLLVFAWLLIISGQKQAEYSQLLLKGATTLGNSVSSHPELSKIFVGINKSLRTAASHGHSYELTEKGIEFKNLKSATGSMSTTEFADTIFAFLESLYGVLWVLDNFLEIEGYEDHKMRPFMFGMNPTKLAQLGLESHNVEVLSTEIVDEIWELRIGASELSPTVIATGVALNSLPGVELIRVVNANKGAHTQEVTVRVQDAVSLVEALEDRPQDAYVMDVVRFLDNVRINGKSPLTPDNLKYTVSVIWGRHLKSDSTDAESIADLRWLLSQLQRRKSFEPEPTIRQIIRSIRLQEKLLPPEANEETKGWALLPMPIYYQT